MPQMPNRHVCHYVPERWPSSGHTDGHMAKSLPVMMAFGSNAPLESNKTLTQLAFSFLYFSGVSLHFQQDGNCFSQMLYAGARNVAKCPENTEEGA